LYYNAYLPLLVDADERVLLASDSDRPSVREFFQNRMSSYGFCAAYVSTLILAVSCVAVQYGLGAGTASDGFLTDRLCIALHGVWWLLLSIPTYFWLNARPGAPFEGGIARIAVSGWVGAYNNIREAALYPQTFYFLICFFFYMDTINTIGHVGVLFASQELCVSNLNLALMMVLLLVAACFGSVFYLWVYKRFSLQPKTMILWILTVYSAVCAYGCIGLIPGSVIGLRSQWELYMFAVIHGFHTGSLQSFSRTLFADLIVPGKEGQFFSLYQVTDKGGSWLGPLVITIIKNSTESLRPGFIFLFFLTGGSAILLAYLLDHKKGMRDVGRDLSTSKA
jgi:MFS transporter, UMF1 family